MNTTPNEELPEDMESDAPSYDLEALNAFGIVLAGKRKEAMIARASAGIEEEWQEDEEHYEGIDDANRPERDSKPQGINGSSNGRRAPSNGNRSTVFVPITAPFVDFAAARACDILLPTDDRGFVVEPTPLPDVEELVTNNDETVIAPDGKKAGEAGKEMLEALKDGAERAQRRIDDWLAECDYNGENRKLIHNAAKVGTGVLKGPFAYVSKSTKVINKDGFTEITVAETIQPKSKCISMWDLFPDYPACGEDIHDGSFVFERDRMAGRGLAELKKVPGYFKEVIDAVLKEGPSKKYETDRTAQPSDTDQFEVWYYYGFATADDLRAAGCDCEDGASIPVMVTMVNDRVIRAVESPLESGKFPYDIMVWSRRVGSPWGIGVSRQMRTPQRMVNAATRAMLDNAGRSSAPQLIVDRSLVEPADGKWEITPGKVWWATADGVDMDVRKAFTSVDIPNNQQQLQNIINFGLEMAERVTGMPILAQGQQGSATQTVGGMTLLDRNSNTPLRMIAKNHDDMITVPHIQRYYEWVLLYGEDEREKANSKIVARGSSILFERDAQNQALMAMGQFVVNPMFEKDPVLWIDEVMRGQRLDPKRLELSEEKKQRIAEAAQAAAQQGAGDGQMQVAQLRVQGDMEKAKLNQQSDMAEIQFKAAEAEKQRQHDFQMRQLEWQMEMAKFAREQNMNLEELKATLAIESAKLNTQTQLSMQRTTPQVATPPSEPAGRAESGRAFEQ